MILSHEHKFIYVKTYKTGSTSIEAALSSVCGPKDVITQASEELRGVRQKPAQNYRLDHPDVPKRPLWRRLLLRPERYYHPTIGYYEHMPAWRVRRYVGEDVWRSYFKFSFERNPWDRQVSWYHYKTKSKDERQRPSFDAFNSDRRRAWVENWDLYTIDGNIAIDFVGRYENLAARFRGRAVKAWSQRSGGPPESERFGPARGQLSGLLHRRQPRADRLLVCSRDSGVRLSLLTAALTPPSS